jgi:dGTPase
VIGHSDEFAAMVREIKDFLYANMYSHYRVIRMAKKAGRFITDLFHAYMKEPAQLPDTTQARLEGGNGTLARVVCDYIAGMTDRYALLEYQKLFDPFAHT